MTATTKMKIVIIVLVGFVAVASAAPAEKSVSVGVAKVDITPDYPVRMTGYAVRKTEATNAAQHIWAKALAIGDKEPALYLTVDNCGVPGTLVDDVARRLRGEGVLPERITVCSSHTHSAPMVNGFAPNIFATNVPPEHQARLDRYTKELADKLEQVARAALKDRKPGHLAWSRGEARFAANRRTAGGPVDHALLVLRATDVTGKIRAVVANYACHCTTLGGEFNEIHGDWAGCAQESLERDHPGAIALISIGCGADANPSPRGKLEDARQNGETLAAEVKNLLGRTFVPLQGEPKCQRKQFELPFGKQFTREEWEERAKQSGIVGFHARKNLERLDRGEKLPATLPYRISTWTFGEDLAMVFLAGEVVVDYSLRLKKELDSSRLWVTAYANDVPCYIPSRRILQEGGYEAESSLWYYDRPARLAPEIEDLIIKTVHDLLPKNFVADPRKAEFPPPKSPAEALAAFRTKADLAVELVAAEPLVVDPVAIDWGADGRLWVVEMHDYPTGMDGKFKPGGRVKVLRNTNGKYDKATLFLDHLPFPTGIMAWKRGALICAAPDILYAEDTDGDGKADLVQTNLTGFATHNYQARVNSLTWGLDGWVYGASGLFGGRIKSLATGKEVDLSGRDFRMKPDSGEIEPVAGLSQQGRVRDDWDDWFGCDNSTLVWHFPMPDHYIRRNPYVPAPEPRVYPVKDADPNRLFPASHTLERFNDPSHVNHTTSACGIEIYRDELLGLDYYGNAFVCEPVHNLVHRLVLEPDGATFAARRAPDEQQSEFLASTDNWFRPVQVRTGPDGALWIVDMYRFVIEHPRWIPPERLAKLDVRAGADQGRIYRVYPRGKKLRPIHDLTRMSTAELAASLDNPNGPVRDLLHRELLSRQGVPLERISKIVTNGTYPAARGQALWLLKQQGRTEYAALTDKDSGVRRQALKLTGSLPKAVLSNGSPFTERREQFQLALSLGDQRNESAATILSSLIPEAKNDRWLKAAILSSAVPHLVPLLETLCHDNNADPDLLEKLVTTAVRANNRDAIDRALNAAVPRTGETATEQQFKLASVILDAQQATPSIDPARFQPVFLQARQAAPAGSSAAIPLLGRDRENLEPDVTLLVNLAAQHPAALQRLRQIRDPLVARQVLGIWPTLSPALRQKFVDVLATREEWSTQLRAAIEQKTVSVAEIPLATRQRLRLVASTGTDRAEVLAKYKGVSDLAPVPAQGSAIFEKNCATCHAFRSTGHAVGPNLAEFAGKSVDDFLVAILDPNAAIEPKFVAYEVEMKDGRSFGGIVRGETATSLTLVQPNGIEERLLRGEIKELRASTLSLMPDGLEQAIAPQDMADLIAWLKQGAPAPFGSASAEQTARAREAFRKERSPMRIIRASEELDYPGWLGRLPLVHCRQTDGRSQVMWEASLAPKEAPVFRFPAALGFLSQPDGEFTLKIDDKAAVTFDVTLHDESWQSTDGRVRMNYAVMENNSEDSNGILTISLDPSLLSPGKPVKFEVVGSAANSQRWFGLYRFEGVSQVAGSR
jgi:putative membrane-bound dehydrogenase-like protein